MCEGQQGRPTVLLVGPKSPTGGIARFVDSCLRAKMGADIQLFNVARPPKERIAFRADGYRELFNAGLSRSAKGIMITLKHFVIFPIALLRSEAKVVHLASTGWFPFWEFSIYGLISKLMRMKVIHHFHGPFDEFYRRSSRVARFFIRSVLKRCDAIIVESHVNEKIMCRFVPSERVFVIPNSVRVIPDSPDRNTDSQRPLRVLFLGGVDPTRKGLLDLIKGASLVAREGSDVEWIVGGTQTGLDLIGKHCPPEAMHSMRFVGLLSESEKTRWYQSCDVFALPSYEEGMPYAILEAMAHGLTIISTRVGGIPEVIAEGRNGYLLEPGDYQGLARRIGILSRDPTLRRRISERNRATVAERFSQVKVFQQIDMLYHCLST